jgi:hypothetical protein
MGSIQQKKRRRRPQGTAGRLQGLVNSAEKSRPGSAAALTKVRRRARTNGGRLRNCDSAKGN